MKARCSKRSRSCILCAMSSWCRAPQPPSSSSVRWKPAGWRLFPIYAVRAAFTETQAALLLTVMGIGNMIFQIPVGMLSDKMKDKRPLLAGMAFMGLIGSLMLPVLSHSWLLMAGVLLFWGGCVAGLYTVGLSHLGSRLTGSDLAAATPHSSSVTPWVPLRVLRSSARPSMWPETTALPGPLRASSAFMQCFRRADCFSFESGVDFSS